MDKPEVVDYKYLDPFTYVKVAKEVEIGISSSSRRVKVEPIKIMVVGIGISKRNEDMNDSPNEAEGKKRATIKAIKDFNRKVRAATDRHSAKTMTQFLASLRVVVK